MSFLIGVVVAGLALLFWLRKTRVETSLRAMLARGVGRWLEGLTRRARAGIAVLASALLAVFGGWFMLSSGKQAFDAGWRGDTLGMAGHLLVVLAGAACLMVVGWGWVRVRLREARAAAKADRETPGRR